MLDVPKIYNDPVIVRKRRGDAIEPYVEIKESIVLDSRARASLNEIPNRYARVKVTKGGGQLFEIEDGFLEENTFKVDYVNGVVYFHESLANQTLNFEYQGEGVYLIPDSRIYLTGDEYFSTARDKFADIDRSILVERHRIDTQLLSHPQPSEIMDVRVDYNGKVFRVAKDRIDAEQKKIEEAYIDAKGIKHSSLKERIDSLQLATESDLDDFGNEINSIWSEINLIPGKIAFEVGQLESDVNHNIELLQSQINIIPNQIELKVQELKSYVDGEFSSTYSQINMLSNQLKLKVDVDGVVSAINLSKEGVRVRGSKIWLDGETHIEDGIIKSAHIESLEADKISGGEIDAGLINIKTDISSNRYARWDKDGIHIKGSAITIERDDGYKTIIDGKLNFNYGVFPAFPSFTSRHVELEGTWCRTRYTEEPANMQFYTFRHEGRYLKLHLGHYMQNHSGNTSGGLYIIESGGGTTIFTKIFRNQGSDSYESIYGATYTVDLGTPTGRPMGIYVRLKSGSSQRWAYGRVIRIWLEG